jgi:hypothetical protein
MDRRPPDAIREADATAARAERALHRELRVVTAPQSTRGSFASLAAALALILAAAALVVALTREPKAEPVQAVERAAAIPPGSIDASRLAPDTLTGAQIEEGRLGPVPRSHRADSAADARRLGGKPASAYLPAARVSSRVVRASAGETKTVMKRPPFTVTMSCIQKPRNALNVVMTASADRRSSIVAVAGRSLPAFGDGVKREFTTITSPKAVWISGQPFTLTAPSGPPIAGIFSAGVKSFGGDCAASVVAIG